MNKNLARRAISAPTILGTQPDRRIRRILSRNDINSVMRKGRVEDVFDENLSLKAKRLYSFIERVVTEARTGNKQPVKALLIFLSTTNNRQWFCRQLMDPSTRSSNEYWSSGQHEWLLRSLIIPAIRRSAGMVQGVQSHAEVCIFGIVDWITVQANLRTPTKYLTFRNFEGTIENRHVGAVRRFLPSGRRRRGGFCQAGNFHTLLINAFNQSTTLDEFAARVRNILKTNTNTGKRRLRPSATRRFLIDGTPTNNPVALSRFRPNLRGSYCNTRQDVRTMRRYSLESRGEDYYSSDSSDEED